MSSVGMMEIIEVEWYCLYGRPTRMTEGLLGVWIGA
jgi:hypothetical protein